MDYLKKANAVIEKLINAGNRKFCIYPFGELGMLVKRILNQRFGITEKYIADNNLGRYENINGILTVERLSEVIEDDVIILLSNDADSKVYSDVRSELLQKISIEHVIDVFSKSMYFNQDIYFSQTQFDHPRLAALEAASREIYMNGVSGDVAECGVYRGKFANFISRLFPDRKIYLFDTFSGFDEKDTIDEQEIRDSGEYRSVHTFKGTTVEYALGNIGYRENAIVRKGWFPDTAKGLEDTRYAFVSLDTDLYAPILAGLEFFYPRLMPGGYIFVDDLRHGSLQGVRKAVIEFCKKEQIGYVSMPDGTDASAIIVKPLM